MPTFIKTGLNHSFLFFLGCIASNIYKENFFIIDVQLLPDKNARLNCFYCHSLGKLARGFVKSPRSFVDHGSNLSTDEGLFSE
jgi:hypothetical protein